jgi:hypothetical protein
MPVRDIGGGVFENEPDGYREEFLYAVEVARALHDPAEDWKGFREALWTHLTRVFGIEDPASMPDLAGSGQVADAGVATPTVGRARRAGGARQRSAATPR